MTLVTYDGDAQKELCALLGISGTASEIKLLFKLAEHYQLDVLTKEISLIPRKGPFIGVWGRLHIAHRSGKLDGLELDDEYDTDLHHCVRCIVWRTDMRHPAAKVIGRVAKADKKDWPYEIARARALRAGLGYAFTIHDSYDATDDENENWMPPPDERIRADAATGEVIDAAPAEEVNGDNPASASTEPRTIIVGGHSLAQRFAIEAKHAGINDDETRHGIIRVLTGGQYQRGTDIPEDAPQEVVDHILDGFAGIADGSLYYRCNPDGSVRGVYKTRKA